MSIRFVVKFELTSLVKKRKIILSWLLPGSFEDIHADISKTRQQGTGTWLIEALGGLGWEDGKVLLVWGHGIGINSGIYPG